MRSPNPLDASVRKYYTQQFFARRGNVKNKHEYSMLACGMGIALLVPNALTRVV